MKGAHVHTELDQPPFLTTALYHNGQQLVGGQVVFNVQGGLVTSSLLGVALLCSPPSPRTQTWCS